MVLDLNECKRIIDEDEDFCEYCGQYFQDDKITYQLSQASFVSGDPDTITDGESEFVKKRFAAGMDIAVQGAHTNNGIYELDTVAAGTLTLTSSNELVSMSYSDSDYPLGVVKISKVNWPKAAPLVVARMIWYLVHRNKPDGELSKTRDGVATKYDRRTAYPREIMQMADRYRLVRFG